MTDFLFDGGWITNAGLLFIVVGYTLVGFVFGFTYGESRADRRAYARERSMRNHPSNQR